MDCQSCGAENPQGTKFCGECGASLQAQAMCPACGFANGPSTRFCRECGFALIAEASSGLTPEPAPTSRRASAPKLPQPTSFCDGRYQVRAFLGEGGKKRVYSALDTKLDRDVAFALIKTDGLDAEGQTRIRREAQAMGRLGDHPHIVSVYDIGDENGLPYLVSQLMAGGDVEALIEKAESHRIPLADALRIADQVCQALEHAHAHGVIHRDLKPGNVWLTAPSTGSGQAIGTAKLGDFGLALALDRSRLTQAGMMVGTVSYLPPEQALGGEVTPRSDLYSLGAMLYELATGRPPFVGDESVAIITQHLNTPPVAPTWHNPEVPPALEVLILRLLEKDPSKRPASAADVRKALAAVRQGQRPGGQEPGPEPPMAAGPASSPLYRRMFIGREAELRHAQTAFDSALSGDASLLMVVGEPGIGKTALCEQLATYVALRGGRTLVGHCYEEGSLSLPYLAFVEAMRTYVLSREPEGLKQDLGTGAQEVARIVSEVRQRLEVEPAPTTGMDPDEARWRLLQAVATFLRNASNVQPLLVVLEDLHWADRGTLDLLIHLVRNLAGARLLLVGTYRDVEVDRTHPLSAALAELRRASDFVRLLLRGLSADEVQRMLGAITGQDISWGFAEAVHRQTEGNPLFVQEVVRYLAEEGLIVHEGGRWERTGLTPLEMSIPEGLRDVIGRRLSRLSAECNRVLTLAAVIGREFDLRTLLTVSGMAEDDLVPALEEAVRVGVLDEETRPGIIRYRFAHAFFRQTLYEELSAPRRLRIHQQVARALETQYATRLEEHAVELADHFAHSTDAADLAKAVEYGRLAARRAMAVHAYGEAARLLQGTVEVQEVLDPDALQARCDLLLALGEALGPAGDPERAGEELAPEALRLAEALGDTGRAAQACELAIEALHRQGGTTMVFNPNYGEWAERWDRYAAPGSRARAYADTILGGIRRAAGRIREANSLVLRSLSLARELEDPEVMFRAAASAMFPGWPPDYQEEQIRLAEEFTRRPREGVRTSTVALVLRRSQGLFLAVGHRDRAEQVWAELERLGEHTRDAVALLWPFELEALRATLDGDLEEVVAAGGRVAARAEELGMRGAGAGSAGNLAFRPLLYLGRGEEAVATAPAQRGLSTHWPGEPPAVVLGLAHTGRHAEARSGLTAYMTWLASAPDAGAEQLSVLAALLEAAVIVGDAEAATALIPRVADVVAAVQYDLGVSNVARHRGGAAALLGDRGAALREYERSLDWATRIHYRPEIALTRLALAELLLGESRVSSPKSRRGQRRGSGPETRDPGLQSEALAHLEFAIAEFQAMKMQPALERALARKALLSA